MTNLEPDPDGDETDPSATVMMLPIEDRYEADDDTITKEDSAMFSLRTGNTIKIDFKQLAIDTVSVPEVPVQALVREMKHAKRKLFAIGASVVAACAALIIYAV